MGLALTAALGTLAWLTWQRSISATDTLWPHIGLLVWAIVLVITSGPRCRRRAALFWNNVDGWRRWSLVGAGVACGIAAVVGWIHPIWPLLLAVALQLWASFDRPHLSVPALALATLISLGVVEATLVWMSQSSAVAQNPAFGSLAQKIYLRFASMFQFEPECSAFDPELLYKIAPGGCVFEGAEFRVRVQGNSLGLPDDELSLEAPEVVFAGDSWTMGWGVEPEQSFAALFERDTGVRALTVAVASYGTARELTMLQRVDRSRLRRLYLQYHPNDDAENQTFVERGCNLERHQPQDYERWLSFYAEYRRYWPGKAGGFLLRGALVRLTAIGTRVWPFRRGPQAPRKAPPTGIESLVGTLQCFADLLDGLEVRIFPVRAPGQPDNPSYLRELDAEVANRAALVSIDIQSMELTPLGSEHFLPLDTHPNAAGHARIAAQLAQEWEQ